MADQPPILTKPDDDLSSDPQVFLQEFLKGLIEGFDALREDKDLCKKENEKAKKDTEKETKSSKDDKKKSDSKFLDDTKKAAGKATENAAKVGYAALLGPFAAITQPFEEFLGFNMFDGIKDGLLSLGKKGGAPKRAEMIKGGIFGRSAEYIVESLKPKDEQGGIEIGGKLGLGGGIMKMLGSGLAIAAIVGSLFIAIKDGFAGMKKAKDWGVSNFAGFVGGFLAGTGSGWKNAFKNAGKWALMGAGIGFLVAGPVGAIAGGLIGGAIGLVLGFFGGQKVATAVQGFVDMLKDMWKQIVIFFEPVIEAFKPVMELFKKIFGDFFGNMGKDFKKIMGGEGNFAEKIGLFVESIFKNLFTLIGDFFRGGGAKKLLKLWWEGIKAYYKIAFKIVKFLVIDLPLKLLTKAWTALWSAIFGTKEERKFRQQQRKDLRASNKRQRKFDRELAQMQRRDARRRAKDSIKNFFEGITGGVSNMMANGGEALETAATAIGDFITKLFAGVSALLNFKTGPIAKAIKRFGKVFSEFFQNLGNTFKAFIAVGQRKKIQTAAKNKGHEITAGDATQLLAEKFTWLDNYRKKNPDKTKQEADSAFFKYSKDKKGYGYATGGIAGRPQIAELAKNGPEMILPLSKGFDNGVGQGLSVSYGNDQGYSKDIVQAIQQLIKVTREKENSNVIIKQSSFNASQYRFSMLKA